jgi:hypothetical protein
MHDSTVAFMSGSTSRPALGVRLSAAFTTVSTVPIVGSIFGAGAPMISFATASAYFSTAGARTSNADAAIRSSAANDVFCTHGLAIRIGDRAAYRRMPSNNRPVNGPMENDADAVVNDPCVCRTRESGQSRDQTNCRIK